MTANTKWVIIARDPSTATGYAMTVTDAAPKGDFAINKVDRVAIEADLAADKGSWFYTIFDPRDDEGLRILTLRLAIDPPGPFAGTQFLVDTLNRTAFERGYADFIHDNIVLKNQASRSGNALNNGSRGEVLLKPSAIAAALKERVHGQDKACATIATAVYENMVNREVRNNKELMASFNLEATDIKKANVFLPGPTGCGKTYIMQSLSKVLGRPVFIYRNTANQSAAGYVGANVEDIFAEALPAVAEYMQKHSIQGFNDWNQVAKYMSDNLIVGIDEVDKIAAQGRKGDVGGQAVQDRLLVVIEGTALQIPIGSGMQKQEITVDTTNIQFVFMGAFSPAKAGSGGDGAKSIVDIVKERKTGGGIESSHRGAVADSEAFLYAEAEDYVKFGFKPEFVGRIMQYYAPLSALSNDDLKHILTKVKGNVVDALRAKFATIGIMNGGEPMELVFENGVFDEVADKAAKKGTGARALSNVLLEKLEEVIRQAPDEAGAHNEVYISLELFETGKVVASGKDKTFRTKTRRRMTEA